MRDLLPEATIIHLEPHITRPEDFDQVLDIVDGKLTNNETLDIADTDGQTDLSRKIKALGRTSVFEKLSRSQLRLLAFASDWFEAKAGDYIFREGDEADASYLITEGLGELRWHGIESLGFEERFIHPGRLIGDLSVIEGRPRTLGLLVRDDIKGLRIGAHEFLEVISNDPEIAMALLRTVSSYLIDITEQLRAEKTRDKKG